jgi:hypothetical protein
MDFIRKAEEAITGKKTESPESTQSSNHGPHSSNLVNKLDPRVDSDRGMSFLLQLDEPNANHHR